MGTAVRTVSTRDAAAMRGDDRLANGEADANSGILGTEEDLEDMFEVRGGDAWPVVKDGKTSRTIFIDRRLHVDPACRLSRLDDRLDAIDQQVDDHLLQLNPVADHLRETGGEGRRQYNRLRIEVMSDEQQGLFHGLIEIDEAFLGLI